MKYSFAKILKNADGTDAVEGGTPATALKGLINAVISDKHDTTAAEKAQRYALFNKLQTGADELNVEEVALLKKAIEIYPTLVYGQLAALLDQSN